MIRVKICGITNIEDAMAAVSAGADALGFIFYPKSPRYITPEDAGEITSKLPPFVVPVGVFVDEPEDMVVEHAIVAGVPVVQLHGDESPDSCTSLTAFGLRVIKAARVRSMEDIEALRRYDADAYLLDAYLPDCPGGTGVTCDWAIALEAKTVLDPVILAGGLTPDNVSRAISTVRPYAVDVSSGVESGPGRKDHDKIRAFIKNARHAKA